MSTAPVEVITEPGQEGVEHVLDALRAIARQQAALLIPVEPIEGGQVPANSKYNPEMHAQLCRMKLLGLTNRAAARAVGISPPTLATWIKLYPKLAYDLEQANGLASAQAAALLQIMMRGTGPTAFHALKLYIETHLPEFQKTTKVEVEHDFKNIAQLIRANIYGLPSPSGAGGAGEGDDSEEAEGEASDGGHAGPLAPEAEARPALLDAPPAAPAAESPETAAPDVSDVLAWL